MEFSTNSYLMCLSKNCSTLFKSVFLQAGLLHSNVNVNVIFITPMVVKQWYAGPHGEFNVKCFVCHGSIGEDFTMQPDAMRCVGCHADQVATMDSSMMSGDTCFDCHHQHRLNPHLAMAKTGEGGSK